MADDPLLMQAPSKVRDLEQQAMRAYRAKHPDGPPWLDLAIETRGVWMAYLETHPNPAGRTKENP